MQALCPKYRCQSQTRSRHIEASIPNSTRDLSRRFESFDVPPAACLAVHFSSSQ